MSKLRKEYQVIVDDVCDGFAVDVGTKIAKRIQELADSKEPVKLTDEEILPMLRRAFGWSEFTTWETIAKEWKSGVRAIEAAVLAKQKEPVTKEVTVRIYKYVDGDIEATTNNRENFGSDWTLLDEFTRTVELK